MSAKIIIAIIAATEISCGTTSATILTPDEDVRDLTIGLVELINFEAGFDVVAIGDGGIAVRRGEVENACGSHDGKEIVISRCSNIVDFSDVVFIHELGHALGLGHSRYRGSIMAPTLQQMPAEEAARCLVSALP